VAHSAVVSMWASPREKGSDGLAVVPSSSRSEWTAHSASPEKRPRSLFRQLDLRFDNPDQEQRYKQGLQGNLVVGGLVCIGSATAATLFAVVPAMWREIARDDGNQLGATFDARVWVFLVWSVNLLLMFIYLLLSATRLCLGRFLWWNWEAFFVLVVSVFLFSMAVANFWHLPMMVGENPSGVWVHDAQGSDIFMLLGIDGILTMVAMYVPLRSSVLWIPFVFAVIPFFVNTIVFQSVFSDSHMILFALLGLSGMAYHGALRREKTHRQKWTFEHMVEQAEEVMREQDNTIQETTAQVKGLRVVAEALCDVIVKLDSKKCVYGANVRQDAFFETKSEGRNFEDLLSEQDRSRFNQLMGSIKVGFPACMPVTIQKEHLSSEVHLLAVDTGMSREPRYLIGMRIEAEHFTAIEEDVARVESLDSPRESRGSAGFAKKPVKVDFEDDDISCKTYPRIAQTNVPLSTPARARALCIKKLLPRWQVPRNMNSCCQYHTIVDSVMEAVELLATTSCEPLFQTFSGVQCPRCLCMCNREQRRCAVCGFSLEESQAPAAELS